MVEFSEDFLNKLTPRNQPFEIKEKPDFAIRVFPNGSKTWVFIDDLDECVQRQTLGVYPQMSIEQAHEALRMVRQSMRSVRRAEQAGKSGEPVYRPEQAPIAKGKPGVYSAFATAAIICTLCVGGLLTLLAHEDFPAVAPEPHKPRIFTEAAAPTAKANAPEPGAEAPIAFADALPDQEARVDRTAPPSKNRAGNGEFRNVSDADTAGELSATQPQALPGEVNRAQFTNGIDDREPIDRLSGVLPTWNASDGARQVFFFTEVRGLGGQNIRHRWELNGQIVSEIPFSVKSSWRWRVFSSKNILPAMEGEWRVSVVDDKDEVLHSETLTLSSPHMLSALTSPDRRPHEAPDP